MRQQVTGKNDYKARDRYSANGLFQLLPGEKMQQRREHQKCRQPAQRNDLPPAQPKFVLMSSLHSISLDAQLPKISFILAAN